MGTHLDYSGRGGGGGVGTYSRWALIQGWVLIRINMVIILRHTSGMKEKLLFVGKHSFQNVWPIKSRKAVCLLVLFHTYIHSFPRGM